MNNIPPKSKLFKDQLLYFNNRHNSQQFTQFLPLNIKIKKSFNLDFYMKFQFLNHQLHWHVLNIIFFNKEFLDSKISSSKNILLY